MRVRVMFSAAIIAGALAAVGGALHAQAPYSKVGEIPIGGGPGWDYLTADGAGKRLYVSHTTEIVVIDTGTNAIVGRIADTPGVHGIVIVPELGRGFSTNGREDKVGIIDLKTLQTLSKVDTGKNPDAITYDPKTKEVYAWNHTGHSATAFDAATGKVTATIPLAGSAETGASDPGLGRLFVNIEDKDSIDVIDGAKHEVVDHWPVAPAEGPTGMAIDPASHRLFVGGGKFLVMIDDTTGKVVSSVPICNGTDATFYDPGVKLVFVSCSDGKVTIAHMDSPAKLTVVQTLDTAPRSRTMALDTVTHKIYLAAVKLQPPDPNAAPPAAGQRARGPAAVAESFHVLVFGPSK
jgi:DNA-binding beta-propeller fold protein YncE